MMEPFTIEVSADGRGRFFEIKPLGNARYEMAENGDIIGTIQLDEKDHARCESQGCELDLPALHAVREGIQEHEGWYEALGHA